MIYRYPEEVHEFVKKWSAKLRDRELAKACNKALGTEFTEKSMKSFRGNHGYRNGQKQWTSEEYWKYQTYYPTGMYEYVRDNSWGVSSKDMAERVNRIFGTSFTPTGMKQFRQRHGIKSGLTGWYQKEHCPGNKGKKQIEYMSPEAIERTKATRFQKGHRPKNELPIGSIVVTTNGYKVRKRKMEGSQWERWEFLHRAVWEKHNGKIPEGMYIIFKDGNKLNCDIENLLMVSRGENAELNKGNYRFEDPDLTVTALNMIRLKDQMKQRRKRA